MKKLLLPLLLIISGVAFGQGQPFPAYQTQGNVSTRWLQQGGIQAGKGIINAVYPDTATANLGYIDYYPGAQIFTTSDRSLWLRDNPAVRWIRAGGSVDITSFNFFNDTTGIICFSNGVCDTFSIVNLFNIVTNIVQNFTDSSVFNINDSTLLICHGQGAARVCDTVHLGNSNTYYFLNDSTLISCDTLITTCVGDSCYQTQLCDTTIIPGQQPIPVLQFQNGVRKLPGTLIVEHGDTHDGPSAAQLNHDTWLYTQGYQYNQQGVALGRPPFTWQQVQWSQVSSSVAQFNHLGNYVGYNPSAIDNNNPVNLYINYIDPYMTGNGVFAGDTIGFMYDRIGYALMTNSQGDRASYLRNSVLSKQTGVMLHTFDTGNTDAVTIFGNQVPKNYAFSVSPFPTTTLLDSRIAVFKTTGQQQNPKYGVGTFYDTTGTFSLLVDATGNIIEGDIVPPTSTITILNDTTLLICSQNRGNVRCDTVRITNITNPTTINIYNDTTIIICNEAGSCDTITVNNYNITNGNVVNIANTVFVAKSGNDATGARQRMDLPFLTIYAAQRAAFTGDVIVVYPGTYEETNPLSLAKSVNYHFIGKGELRLSTSVGSGSIFTDSTTVSYSKIWGEHWTFNARSSQRVLNQVAASTVEMVADSLISVNGRTVNTASGARTTLTANYMYGSGFLGGELWIAGGYFYGDIGMIETEAAGTPVWLSNVPSFTLHAKRVFSQDTTNADYMVHISDSDPTDSIFIDIDEIYSQKEWAIWAEGESQFAFITAKRISANSDCVVTSTLIGTGMLTVRADVIENRIVTTMDGIVNGEAGSITVIGAKIKRQSGATGADILTSNFGGQDGHVYLNSVSYDITKVTEVTPGTIKRIDSLYYGSNFQFTNGRLETDTAQIVAANNLTLGRANVNLVSGATQITAITTSGWQAGSASVFLQFSGAPLVKHNTAGGAGTAPIKLAGTVDFQAAADDVLGLEFDGTYWHETSRKLASSAGITGITGDNAITATTATNVQLGATASGATNSPLLHNTYINTTSLYRLIVYGEGTTTVPAFEVSNFSGGVASKIWTSSSTALWAQSNSGIPLYSIQTNATNLNAATELLSIDRGTQAIASAQNGIGAYIGFHIETSSNSGILSNQIISTWTDVTHGTRKSQLDFTGVYNASTNTIMSAYGSGVVGIGISSSYTATRLNVVDNAISTIPMIDVTSTSTGAASNLQKGINVSLSGANSNSGQSSYGIYSSNTHTGSGSVRNYGVYGVGSGGTFDAGVRGDGDYWGVYGSGGAYGVNGVGGTAGVLGEASGGGNGVSGRADVGIPLTGLIYPSSTNTVLTVLKLERNTDGTPTAGIGGSIDFYNGQTGGSTALSNIILSKLTDPTLGSITSTMVLQGKLSSATVDLLTLAGDGSVKLRPISATAASAITPAEGMLLIVNTTDATFTSTGFWGYSGGAWGKLTN